MFWAVLFALIAGTYAQGAAVKGSAYLKAGQWSYKFGVIDTDAVAYGTWDDSIPRIGWGHLQLTTNPKYKDTDQAFGAGFLEAVFTRVRVYQHYQNIMKWKTDSAVPPQLRNYMMKNAAYVNKTIEEKAATDPYWHQVGCMWAQHLGFVHGYLKVAPSHERLSYLQLLLLASKGDLFDLIPALIKSERPDLSGKTTRQVEEWINRNLHCSASYKITDDLSELYFGHTAWYTYTAMMRIIKVYNFQFTHESTAAKTIHMSSYPGLLSSFDDYYLMSSGLNTIETSIGVFNHSLYDDYITPEGTVLYWLRVMVANRMAKTPKQWCETFKMFNSGTYNNQWMALKIDAFTPKKPLPSGSFYVLGQLPGPYVEYSDETDVLNFGYWPSYNVPYHKELEKVSGYTKYGMNYYSVVRADIFRRDQAKVTDMKSYKHLMTYNGYGKGDPLAKTPDDAISARADLAGECGGGYDSKVSSYSMWKDSMSMDAQAGPTHQQPIFSFKNTTANCPKDLIGLPEVWNFPYVTFKVPSN